MRPIPKRPPRRRAALAVVVALAAAGGAAAIARAEEEASKRVLTVEKLGGPEAVVGDEVSATLETGTKVQFIKSNGEVSCTESEVKGKVKTNPETGTGNGVIEIETFTFKTCSSTVGGAGGKAEKIEIESLPLLAETEGTNQFKITDKVKVNMGVKMTLKTEAGVELICIYRAQPLKAKYKTTMAKSKSPKK